MEDDGLQPAKGKQIVDRMSLDGISLYTGVMFSNVLAAVVNSATQGDRFYISANAGPFSVETITVTDAPLSRRWSAVQPPKAPAPITTTSGAPAARAWFATAAAATPALVTFMNVRRSILDTASGPHANSLSHAYPAPLRL